MAKQTINIGTTANDGTGDTLRNAFSKINGNTDELYTAVGNALTQVDLTSDVTGVLPIANIATGTPTGAKFVRDDGVLATPAGGGGGSSEGVDVLSTGVTAGRVLTADGSNGATWETPASGGGGSLSVDDQAKLDNLNTHDDQTGGSAAATESNFLYGQSIWIDTDIALPVLTSDAVGKIISVVSFSTSEQNVTLASNVTLAGAPVGNVFPAKAVFNLMCEAANGTTTTYRMAISSGAMAEQVAALDAAVQTAQENVATLAASLEATDDALLDLATKAELSSIVPRTGSAYTVLVADFGRDVTVDGAITLPVLTAASQNKRIGIINLGSTVTYTLPAGVTLSATSPTDIEAGAAASMFQISSDGTNAVWHVIGGKA